MWKWFLYILILFNISFFVWNSRSGIPLVDEAQNEELDDAVKLLLLKEQQHEPPIKNIFINNSLTCFSVGSFARKTEVNAAQKKLKKWGIQANLRVHKSSTKGFWVIIPSAKTRKDAQSKIKKLKELGINDYFLVATGSQKNAVSLGVFSKSSSAKRRLKEMKQKGVSAQVSSVDLPKRSYWLDWPTTGSKTLSADQLNILQKSFKGIGKVSLNCTV